MGKSLIHFFTTALAMLILASCAKDIAIDGAENPEDSQAGDSLGSSTLIVQTRNGDSDADEVSVSYPVQIYVFDKSNTCTATSTIEDETNTFSMKLKKGSYNVFAVAGATPDSYVLPSADEATPQSTINLKEGKSHTDLMAAAQSPVELTDGGTNTLTVSLNRKVLMIQDIIISGLPSTVTAVSVSLSPLYEGIRIDGEYTGLTASNSVALTKTGEGVWKNSETAYIMPASGTASITVAVTTNNETLTYSYTSEEELEANHKVSIKGHYNSGELAVSGAIVGTQWGEDRNIEFEFADEGSKGTDDEPVVSSLELGTYCYDNRCFVTDIKDNADGSFTATLMTTKEVTRFTKKGATKEEIKAAADSVVTVLAVDGIEGWRLPTLDELEQAMNYFTPELDYSPSGIDMFLWANYYCYLKDDGTIQTRSGQINDRDVAVDEKSCIRAFTTVTIK